MKLRELLVEASYDSMIIALKKSFPDQTPQIDNIVKWAKTVLKKSDRVVWFIKIYRAYLNDRINGTNTLPPLLGTYVLNSIEVLGQTIEHYFGYPSPDIQNYSFGNKTVSDVLTELDAFEQAYKKKLDLSQPVKTQQGDYELIKFNDGSAWWWVDRAYCPEEGRSGKHCGNVAGRYKTDQRILSYRVKGHVYLTFILEPNGLLGEMKARNNQKPAENLHPFIMSLLLSDYVKGIQGAGYLPEMNFSVFDLNDKDLKTLYLQKPELITTQIQATPIEIMKAPSFIKNDPNFKSIAIEANYGLEPLLNMQPGDNELEAWDNALDRNYSLLLYAPETLPDYQSKIIRLLSRDHSLILQAPKHVGRNFEILKHVVNDDAESLRYIVPTTPKFKELCKIALDNDIHNIQFIPDEVQEEMAKSYPQLSKSFIKFVDDKVIQDTITKVRDLVTSNFVNDILNDWEMDDDLSYLMYLQDQGYDIDDIDWDEVARKKDSWLDWNDDARRWTSDVEEVLSPSVQTIKNIATRLTTDNEIETPKLVDIELILAEHIDEEWGRNDFYKDELMSFLRKKVVISQNNNGDITVSIGRY